MALDPITIVLVLAVGALLTFAVRADFRRRGRSGVDSSSADVAPPEAERPPSAPAAGRVARSLHSTVDAISMPADDSIGDSAGQSNLSERTAMTAVPTSFVAHLSTAAGNESVIVELNKIELDTWGLHESVPWMKLSSFISQKTTTQNKTLDGRTIIVNWGALPLVTYDNPWADISSERRLTLKRGQWVN